MEKLYSSVLCRTGEIKLLLCVIFAFEVENNKKAIFFVLWKSASLNRYAVTLHVLGTSRSSVLHMRNSQYDTTICFHNLVSAIPQKNDHCMFCISKNIVNYWESKPILSAGKPHYNYPPTFLATIYNLLFDCTQNVHPKIIQRFLLIIRTS